MWAWFWSCRTFWMWAWFWSCRTCWMWAWSWSCRTCWMVIRSRCGWLITRSGTTLWRPIDMNRCCSVSNRAIWEVNINLLYVITWNLHIIYNLLGVSPPCCCSGWDGSTTCQNHKGWWLRGNQAVGNLWCWQIIYISNITYVNGNVSELNVSSIGISIIVIISRLGSW